MPAEQRAGVSAAQPTPGDDPAGATDAYLDRYVRGLPLPGGLRDAVLYALLGPGKRLRPVLAWRCCEAAGGPGPQALPAAGAVELVHAFSLVHDDLPAMDDDDVRRGRPTLHRHTSEAMAVLAGDGMLTFAFGLVTQGVGDAALARRLCAELAGGATAMIVGQVCDTLGGPDGGLTPEQRLEHIHGNKTGALIRAACRMGGLCAYASDRTLGILDRYADAVGLMFQIVDDILDVTQPASHVGKRTGKDINAGKATYPGLLGLEASRRRVVELEARAVAAAQMLGAPGEPLARLAAEMAVRTR